jgi:alkane 1-monooxygenase
MMGISRVASFTLPYLIPILLVPALLERGLWTWAAASIVFLLHPLFDSLIGRKPAHVELNAPGASLLLWAYVPLQAGFLVWAITTFSNAPLEAWEKWGLVISTGSMTGAIGITAAHELVHRRSAFERGLGAVLLYMVTYGQFRVEHVSGHHLRVGTRQDPATARRGEMIYAFWMRSIFMGLLSAWKIELNRHSFFKNRMVHDLIFQGALYFAVFQWQGWAGIQFLAFQSLVAVLLLETINYVEHYGLSRAEIAPGRFEPVSPKHSWDSSHWLTNRFLFNLGYHAQHHREPTRHFEKLEHLDDAPRMPGGYSTMMLAALVPPLWNHLMERNEALRDASDRKAS